MRAILLSAILLSAAVSNAGVQPLFGGKDTTPEVPATVAAPGRPSDAGWTVTARLGGARVVALRERSPLSSAASIHERLGPHLSGREQDYTLGDERFLVFDASSLAIDTTSTLPPGVLVMVLPYSLGELPPAMVEALGRWLRPIVSRRITVIVPAEAPNTRVPLHRLGLALDAAHNAPAAAPSTAGRVYVAGISGGGRIASMLGLGYPDVFDGAAPAIGCNYFRPIESLERPGIVFPAVLMRPDPTRLQQARTVSRYALLTGEFDGNRDETKSCFVRGFQRDGFQHVTYLEVPDLGHENPPGPWWGRAVDFLDAPLASKTGEDGNEPLTTNDSTPQERAAATRWRVVEEARRAGRHEQAYRGCEWILRRAPDSPAGRRAAALLATYQADVDLMATIEADRVEREAATALSEARGYEHAGRLDDARRVYQMIIEKWPQTSAGGEAARALRRISQ